MNTVYVKNKGIGDGQPCFIIAEMGSNHNGKMSQAKELVEIVAQAGCDALKFQNPIAKECYPPGSKFGGIYGEQEVADVIRKNEIPAEWIQELVDYGHNCGLLVGASTDGFIGLSRMLAGGVDFVKMPSFTISHIPLLEKAGETDLPWLLSTGVHSLGQIEEALAAVAPAPVAIFHCVSAYPALPDSLNLRNIDFFKTAFDIPTGFSDHSLDPIQAPTLAVALGANMLEKHYTLDRNLEGPDHSFALEPNELGDMVRVVREVENDPDYRSSVLNNPQNEPLVGDIRREGIAAEEFFEKRTRLGLYFKRSLRKGEEVAAGDIQVFRCADTEPGLHPRFMELVVGASIVCDSSAFEPVRWEHILQKEAKK